MYKLFHGRKVIVKIPIINSTFEIVIFSCLQWSSCTKLPSDKRRCGQTRRLWDIARTIQG